jgi:hypothetical protein
MNFDIATDSPKHEEEEFFFECDDCDEDFISEEDLKNHLKIGHGGPEKARQIQNTEVYDDGKSTTTDINKLSENSWCQFYKSFISPSLALRQ